MEMYDIPQLLSDSHCIVENVEVLMGMQVDLWDFDPHITENKNHH